MIVSWCCREENRLINTHNTKQNRRFSQHQETPKITIEIEFSTP